jgi:hypothetical protein
MIDLIAGKSVRGLDNVRKTTIVKCINGEDTNRISPILGKLQYIRPCSI